MDSSILKRCRIYNIFPTPYATVGESTASVTDDWIVESGLYDTVV